MLQDTCNFSEVEYILYFLYFAIFMFNRGCLVIFDIWKDEREDLLEQISQIIGKVLQMVNLLPVGY